jgi:hypothetical protein
VGVVSEPLGVGDCPKRPEGFGHIWKSWKVDPRKSCEFCGRPGRDNLLLGESGGFFAEATDARYEVFAGLAAPMQSGTGKPRELTAEQQARVDVIIADKKRRDAEAVANGTARPGQIAGAPKGSKS